MSSQEPLVSIVIVTYNAMEYVRKTLESVRSKSRVPHEIIVVDNASGPETVDYLRAQSDIRLFANEDNLLWSAGCNQGMSAAHPASRYLLLLNPDVEILRPDWLEILIETIEQSPKVGLAGPLHKHRPMGPVYGFIDGHCLLFRRELIEELGPMNSERFPMAGGPALHAVRAFKRGWLYKVVHPSVQLLVHHERQSRKVLGDDEKPWAGSAPPDYNAMVREEGLDAQPQSKLSAWLERTFEFIRARRFYYSPPPKGGGKRRDGVGE